MLNTYAEDFLRKGSEEYRKVKMMSNQIKYKKSMPELRFCDFVKKYVEQFMLQGETIKCKPFEQQLMETNKMNTITSFRTELKNYQITLHRRKVFFDKNNTGPMIKAQCKFFVNSFLCRIIYHMTQLK